MYIGAEVVMANLLAYSPTGNKGINNKEIVNYCNKLHDTDLITKYPSLDCCYFAIDSHDVETALLLYNDLFFKLFDQIYATDRLSTDMADGMNKRYTHEIALLLINMAKRAD